MSAYLKEKIGRVYADNVNDAESLDSIRLGIVGGKGLLGEVQTAAYNMAEQNEQCGYFGDHATKEMYQARIDSRVQFYHTLKAIESASAEIERRLLDLQELHKLCLPHVQAAAQAEHTLSCVGPRHELPIDRLLGEVKAALK